jgi:hypothetical protein
VSTSTRWRAHATPAVVLGALLLALTAAAFPFAGGPAGRPAATTARAVLAALPPTGTAPAGRAASTGVAGRPGTAGAGAAGLRTAGARSDDAAAPQRGHSPQHWGLLALVALLLTGLGPALRRPGRRATRDGSRPSGTASRGPPRRAFPPAVPRPA